MRIAAPIPQQGVPTIPTNPNFFEKRKKSSKIQKSLEICQNKRYALQPEVSYPSGSIVCGQTKNTQQPFFFEKLKKQFKTQKLKNVQKCAKISNIPCDQRSPIPWEAWFPPCFARQNQLKKLFFCSAILDHFQTTIFKSETTSFYYFTPRILNLYKILDIQLWEVGAKRRLNGTSKVNTHTDRRTDGQTDRQLDKLTYRKHRPRGPML